jgi:hypothetical protein
MEIYNDPVQVAVGPPLPGKLAQGADGWRKLNGSFENKSITPYDLLGAVLDGCPITTWHDGWRKTENFLLAQHVGVDFDTGDKRSALETLAADPFIEHYASFLYTTPSHTEAAPRARAVFVLDAPITNAAGYGKLVAAIIWMFGGVADSKAKDAVRFFYGANPTTGEGHFLGHLLTLQKARQVTRLFLDAHKPIKDAKKKSFQQGLQDGGKNDTIADLEAALATIDPWALEYDEWVEILMAIHSAHPGNDGLALAESWGQGKPREVEVKWRSFKPTGGVTIATIYHFARRQK